MFFGLSLLWFVGRLIDVTFLMAVFTLGLMAFATAGPIKQYELRALGDIYIGFLERIESGARDLKTEYYANDGYG
jgi:hypothetical protein